MRALVDCQNKPTPEVGWLVGFERVHAKREARASRRAVWWSSKGAWAWAASSLPSTWCYTRSRKDTDSIELQACRGSTNARMSISHRYITKHGRHKNHRHGKTSD